MEWNRKTPAVVMIVLGLVIFMLPFTPRWMVDWFLTPGGNAYADTYYLVISPMFLVVTASVGSGLFLTGMWKLFRLLREDRE